VDIAITGAAGFIGSNMAKYLIEEGHRVHAIDHAEPTDPFRLGVWNECHNKSVIDLTTTEPVFATADMVIHLAANMGGVGFFHKHDYQPYIDNSRITFNVLSAIARWEIPTSFVASSACIYPTHLQMDERRPAVLHEDLIEFGWPDQMYGREKLMLLRLAERHEQDVRVGILHTVYGVGQECEGERMKFPTAAATKAIKARETGFVSMWGNGEQMRSYLYVDDAVNKIWAIMNEDYDGPVNVGYQGAVSCNDIQRLCLRIAGAPDAKITTTLLNPRAYSGATATTRSSMTYTGICRL
jgi:nucleoside-diphosphate-sugar epimerase